MAQWLNAGWTVRTRHHPAPTVRVLRADVHVVQPDAAQPPQPPHQHQVLVVQQARRERQRAEGTPCMPCSAAAAAAATAAASGTASRCGMTPRHSRTVVHSGCSAQPRRRGPGGDIPCPPPPAQRLGLRILPLRAVMVASMVVVVLGVVRVMQVVVVVAAACGPAAVAPAAAARTPHGCKWFTLAVGLRAHVHFTSTLLVINVHGTSCAVAALPMRGTTRCRRTAKGNCCPVGQVACPPPVSSPSRPCRAQH